jgi:hypothetical protein
VSLGSRSGKRETTGRHATDGRSASSATSCLPSSRPARSAKRRTFSPGWRTSEVERREQPRAVVGVAYDLHHHCLQELEGTLEDQGYHLDNTLMSKMMRALIYYVEETQLHNLDAPVTGHSSARSRKRTRTPGSATRTATTTTPHRSGASTNSADPMNDGQLLRYSRHILLDEVGIEGQERLGRCESADHRRRRSRFAGGPVSRVCRRWPDHAGGRRHGRPDQPAAADPAH